MEVRARPGRRAQPFAGRTKLSRFTGDVWSLPNAAWPAKGPTAPVALSKERRSPLFLYEGFECLGVIRMPPRKWRPVFDDVLGSPDDASLVKRAGGVIVGAENIEVACIQPLDHEINRLLRRPGPCR